MAAALCGGLAGCGSSADALSLTAPAQRALAAVPADDQQFCATVTRQMSALPSKPTGDPSDAATLGANFAELAAIAPPELRPDLQTLAQTFQGSGDPSSAMSALHNYVDYLGKHCGITVPLDSQG